MDDYLSIKLRRLKKHLQELGSVVVAFSGGLDSTFLLAVSRDILKDRVLAVTALSETYPEAEARQARLLARHLGVRHRLIHTREFDNRVFKRNPPDRCYYCKKELFGRLKRIARRYRLNYVLDGSNADDAADYRPGAVAKREAGIVSPLLDGGWTKQEIRRVSRRMKLATWNKPAGACLASRIPYGSLITRKRLYRIVRAEELLRAAYHLRGNLRVRDFGDRARIEVDKKEIPRIKNEEKLTKLLAGAGYRSVEVDPRGYRTGSLNEGLRGD